MPRVSEALKKALEKQASTVSKGTDSSQVNEKKTAIVPARMRMYAGETKCSEPCKETLLVLEWQTAKVAPSHNLILSQALHIFRALHSVAIGGSRVFDKGQA